MNYTTWEDLLEISKNYRKIVVSGCQRSGTTYATKALSLALCYEFCDERRFKTSNIKMFDQLLEEEAKMVIQAPAILHKLGNYEDKFLLVIMIRNREDVVNSMIKHDWYSRYGYAEWKKFSNEFCKRPEDIYDIKLSFANKLKKINLKYEELRKTKGFVEKRVGWKIKQISESEPFD